MRKEKRGRISRQDLQVGGKNGLPKEMKESGQGPWEQVLVFLLKVTESFKETIGSILLRTVYHLYQPRRIRGQLTHDIIHV